MKNTYIKITILLLLINCTVQAQTNMSVLQDAKMQLQSIDKLGKPFEASTNFCYMFLNLTNGDFMFKTDLSTLISLDTLTNINLYNSGSQPIVFKSNINENLFRFIHDENDGKMYDMQGILTINGNDIPCMAQFDPISFGDKNDKKNYRLDFRMFVDANKINIKGLENKLSKQVLFEIARGILNVTN